MTRSRRIALALPVALLVVAGAATAQRFGGRRMPPAPISEDRKGVPDWKVDEKFKDDVFTFVRIEYDDDFGQYGGGGFGGRRGGGRGGWGGKWRTDFPDSDLNFSYRLQQLTSLKVNPEPITMRLTDGRLYDYPFLYLIEPGALSFSEEEVVALRRYLSNGGFLMVDDFWGDMEYENFRRQIRRVYDRDPEELPLDHPIFHCVYDLKEKPQVPSIDAALDGRAEGITYESHHYGNVKDVHYRGLHDDKGRLVAIVCHNTDLGDGWEREGEDPWYFKEFAEKKAYPLGINIVTYAMTH